MTTRLQTQPSDSAKNDQSGPAGALVALQRAAQTARKLAETTHTQVITVANSSVARQLNLSSKR